MFQFVDLLKLSKMMARGSISKLNLAVVLGDRVPCPPDFEVSELPIGSTFVEGKLLCGAFPRSDMEQSVLNEDYKDIIRYKMKEVHLLSGNIAVLVPDSYINFGLISVYGRLSLYKGSQCQFYLAQWRFNQNAERGTSKFKISPVNRTAPTEMIYTKEYMDWLDSCSKSGNYAPPVSIPESLQETGVEIEVVAEPVKITPSGSVSDILLGGTPTNLGVDTSNSSAITGLDIKEHTPYGVTLTTNKPRDIFRTDIVPVTDGSRKVKSILNGCKDRVTKLIDKLKTNNSIEEVCIAGFAQNLATYWSRKPQVNRGNTGRDIFKMATEIIISQRSKSSDEENDINSKSKKFRKENIEPIFSLYSNSTELVNAWGKGTSIEGAEFVSQYRSDLLYAVIEVILGLDCDLVTLRDFCRSQDICLLDLINTNPYKLCLISSSISLSDMDKLAMAVGVFKAKDEIERYRTIAYLHHYMCDPNNIVLNSDTCILRSKLEKSLKVGYTLTKSERKYMISNDGVWLRPDTYVNLMSYFFDMTPDCCRLPTDVSKWKSVDGYHEYLPIDVSSSQAVDWYIESGIGVQTVLGGKPLISDYAMASKEYYIYQKVHEMFSSGEHRKVANIDTIISEFEAMKCKELEIPEFKLEDRQREAVKLVGTPVFAVTGGAGCGKTTTAEAIVYALKEVYGFDDDNIMYVAPTGKAANRLKESVKHDTSTIHSLFHIGGSSTYVLNNEDDNKLEMKVLIVDESSMINVDIMYTMMRGLSNSTILIFLGDIAQLSPIGFGKPFANLLDFIPCVKLNVSKRASAKSNITRNANEINEKIDGVLHDLQDGDDFKNIDIPESEVVDCICELVKYHLGKLPDGSTLRYPTVNLGVLSKEDIQVVTPVRKSTYAWGSDNLNTVLQDIFNPFNNSFESKTHRSLYYTMGNGKIVCEYRVGDRVIHSSKNIRDKTRYIYTDGFKPTEDTGVMNGDMGVIKRVILGTEMQDMTSDEELLNFSRDNFIFIEVEYDNVCFSADAEPKFSILYPVPCLMDLNGGNYSKIEGRYVTSSPAMTLLSLAYALTVHKMQGSQSKLIIAPMYKMKRKGFISRNMIYTAITRASKGCYIIGDVKHKAGGESALEEARQVEVTDSRDTLLQRFSCG